VTLGLVTKNQPQKSFRGWWGIADREASIRFGCKRIRRGCLRFITNLRTVPKVRAIQQGLSKKPSGRFARGQLNKNATGMGTPVADKLNQKDWLNCYAETRPWGYREQAPILI